MSGTWASIDSRVRRLVLRDGHVLVSWMIPTLPGATAEVTPRAGLSEVETIVETIPGATAEVLPRAGLSEVGIQCAN